MLNRFDPNGSIAFDAVYDDVGREYQFPCSLDSAGAPSSVEYVLVEARAF